MRRDGAAYMFVFAGAVCVVCAVVVSTAAVVFKDRQEINKLLDKQTNVLYAAGLAAPESRPSRDEVLRIFDERVTPVVIDMESGAPVEDPPIDPTTYNAEQAAAGPEGFDAPENSSRIKRLPKYQVVYEIRNQSGGREMVVIPIKGYGLWSTLYGFLALDNDGDTIRGITYYQHGETPGLGGEVDNPRWKALWPGREAYDDQGEVAISVIKGQAGSPQADPHHVDGLSGASLTSRGVTNMLHFWLGENGFGPYLENIREKRA